MWLLYGERGTTITDVATLWWQIFSRSHAKSQNMPPTRATLVQHTCSRAVNCVDYGWGSQTRPTKSCPVCMLG